MCACCGRKPKKGSTESDPNQFKEILLTPSSRDTPGNNAVISELHEKYSNKCQLYDELHAKYIKRNEECANHMEQLRKYKQIHQENAHTHRRQSQKYDKMERKHSILQDEYDVMVNKSSDRT
eukprot:360357_1